MRIVGVACLAALACGNPEPKPTAAPPAPPADAPPAPRRFAKVKQPPVSPICAKARAAFGYGSECEATELPELASAAGTLHRVVRKGDPTATWLYVLVRPDGTMALAEGRDMLDIITGALDLEATPPVLLAKLHAALEVESAVVRCLPGSGDVLPKGYGRRAPCKPPRVTGAGDRRMLRYVVEQFPHPRLDRSEGWIYEQQVRVTEDELDFEEGTGLAAVPADAPRPPGLPPLPTMTTPPAYVATPVEAPPDVDAALCKAAATNWLAFAGRRCKAYGYPELDLPAGSLYYLANDAGREHALALRRPDGTIAVGFELSTSADPITPLVATYDPAVVPPARLVAAHLFLEGEAVRILCLPGSGDTLPDDECRPPSAERQGDELVVSAIVLELPVANSKGMLRDPAVRAFTLNFTRGGGFSGGGVRLIDLREDP